LPSLVVGARLGVAGRLQTRLKNLTQISFAVGLNAGDLQNYDFSKPVDLENFVAEEPLFSELVATPAFRRLQAVRFLGGIDYLLVPSPNGTRGNVRYTRFQHSLGVARLALMYARACGLSPVERSLIVAAALLHDVGHAPLSHSLEPVFLEAFGMEHHQATRDVVLGHVEIGRDVFKCLRRHKVDVDRLLGLISGEDHAFHDFFAGPINIDTIEGILRTKRFAQSAPNSAMPELIVEAATSRTSSIHQDIVDQFWTYKDQVYRHVINSNAGILADQVCQAFMRNSIRDIEAGDYFTTEESLFLKLRGLRQLLTSATFSVDASQYLPKSISYKERRFFIDQSVSFFGRDDRNRYLQTRGWATINVADMQFEQQAKLMGDLFSDEGNR
jgi:HD superfamily phosphohydrolase